jgi:hypothetical protein
MLVHFRVGFLGNRSNFHRFGFQRVCNRSASRLAAKGNGLSRANVHSITDAILVAAHGQLLF